MSTMIKPFTHLGTQDRAAVGPVAPAAETVQGTSVYFDGVNESLAKANADLNIDNAWTIAFWHRNAATPAGHVTILSFLSGGVDSTILFSQRGDVGNDPLRVAIYDQDANVVKNYDWDSYLTVNTWIHTMATWNGTALLLYKNGVLTAETTKITDEVGTGQTNDVPRTVAVGARQGGALPWNGAVHSVGVWDSVMTVAEAVALYNGGLGNDILYGADSGNYVSSADLVHWWRCGFDSADIGADSVAANAADLMDNANNITAADVIANSPGSQYQMTSFLGTGGVGGQWQDLVERDRAVGFQHSGAVWMKPNEDTLSVAAGNQYIFWAARTADDQDTIRLSVNGAVADDPLRIQLWDQAGALFKDYSYAGYFTQDEWVFVSWTWNDTTLQMYKNGSPVTPTGLNTDNAGTMSTDSRTLRVGSSGDSGTNNIAGIYHSVGWWNGPRTAAEWVALYNGGDGRTFPWDADSGDYVSSASLSHWYRLGYNMDDTGNDYGTDGDDLAPQSGVDTYSTFVNDSPRI